ncbi:MAG: YdiU family protein [Parasphingorhabdus sp.]|nr:YdiU family protein [Parasphingorhabdus sp.]
MPFTPPPEPAPALYAPDPQIGSLGPKIGDPVAAARFPKTILRYRNDRWAATVGLETLDEPQWLAHFGRFTPLPDNLTAPLALRYHGHQFRNYNPDIGDGRGFLFAQLRDGAGRLLDLATKGSGTTPYSRDGDGRLTLKGGVREILATELLEALGVDTSKTFSLIETGEELTRGDEPSPTRSAVLVRLSHSHIRIGTFQRIAFEQDAPMMRALVDYCLRHFFGGQQGDDPVAEFFDHVTTRVATLAAGYMATGFVHGVLNTDNINITGESFDYGPWRFMPYWEPGYTAAYFDHSGLYCYARQPEALHWNLAQLGSALTLIGASEPLIKTLEGFPRRYGEAYVGHMLWRLGRVPQGFDADKPLVMAIEAALALKSVTLDQFFQDFRSGEPPQDGAYAAPEFATLRENLSAYALTHDGSARQVAACSLHIEEVEAIWSAIAEDDDWQPLQNKISEIRGLGRWLRGAD